MARTKWISASQAADLARVDRRTIINWCAEKRFACSKVGETWIVNERSLLVFLGARLAFK
jgi:hypothetical protein